MGLLFLLSGIWDFFFSVYLADSIDLAVLVLWV